MYLDMYQKKLRALLRIANFSGEIGNLLHFSVIYMSTFSVHLRIFAYIHVIKTYSVLYYFRYDNKRFKKLISSNSLKIVLRMKA